MKTLKQLLDSKNKELASILPDQTVLYALHLMAEKDVGALLVLEGKRLAGVFSERDYARKVVLQGRSSSDTAVQQIMSSPVVCVGPMESVSECMGIMTDRHIRHLPVVDDGQVVGIVSIGDLVKEVIEEQKQEINYLQQYISG